jgi:hypothetical protein
MKIMKSFIKLFLVIVFAILLNVGLAFLYASIVSFLLGFIGIHEIMNYETTYFLFIIFLIVGIITSYFKKSESK